jgi:hypothetical protein
MAKTSVHTILDLMVSMQLLVMATYVLLLEYEGAWTGCANLPFGIERSRIYTTIIGTVLEVGTHKLMCKILSVTVSFRAVMAVNIMITII